MSERELAKKDITEQIDFILEHGFMSEVNGTIALSLLKTYIKYMDED